MRDGFIGVCARPRVALRDGVRRYGLWANGALSAILERFFED